MQKESLVQCKKLISAMKKTEIHLHIEGLASVDSIWTLIKKNKIDKGIESKADLRKKFKINNLEEFLDLFINIIQNSFVEENDLNFLVEDIKNYLIRNNIVYAETFFAPSKFLQTGFSFKKMADILDKGADKIKKETGREIKYLIDVSRTFGVENAMKNLDHILENRVGSIIGIGLGGSEQNGPAKEYKDVYKKAAENGLHAVAHAGEDVGPRSIWDALEYLKAERIGHGISAVQDENLMDYLKKKQIPLEVCPSSNLFTKRFATTLENHPVKKFYSDKLNVTINTDDPTLFGTELIEEYMNLIRHKIFTIDEITDLIKKNIFATFMPEKNKRSLWEENLKIIESFN